MAAALSFGSFALAALVRFVESPFPHLLEYTILSQACALSTRSALSRESPSWFP